MEENVDNADKNLKNSTNNESEKPSDVKIPNSASFITKPYLVKHL